jgi:hypothetical protein
VRWEISTGITISAEIPKEPTSHPVAEIERRIAG